MPESVWVLVWVWEKVPLGAPLPVAVRERVDREAVLDRDSSDGERVERVGVRVLVAVPVNVGLGLPVIDRLAESDSVAVGPVGLSVEEALRLCVNVDADREAVGLAELEGEGVAVVADGVGVGEMLRDMDAERVGPDPVGVTVEAVGVMRDPDAEKVDGDAVRDQVGVSLGRPDGVLLDVTDGLAVALRERDLRETESDGVAERVDVCDPVSVWRAVGVLEREREGVVLKEHDGESEAAVAVALVGVELTEGVGDRDMEGDPLWSEGVRVRVLQEGVGGDGVRVAEGLELRVHDGRVGVGVRVGLLLPDPVAESEGVRVEDLEGVRVGLREVVKEVWVPVGDTEGVTVGVRCDGVGVRHPEADRVRVGLPDAEWVSVGR